MTATVVERANVDRRSQNSSTAAQTPFRGSGGVSDAFVSTCKA